jgi:ABC-2 type transport system permease protein
MNLVWLEIVKLRFQKRTWIVYIFMALIVVIGTIALAHSNDWGGSRNGDNGPGAAVPIIAQLFKNGVAMPLMALLFITPFLLPLASSMIGSFSIAGEAESGTLRTVLTRPVRRGSLLAAKTGVSLLFVASILLFVYILALICGQIAFGIKTPFIPFFSVGEILGRTALGYLIALVAMTAVVSLATLISTLTNSSLTALISSMVLVIVLQVLLAFSFFDWLRPWLFTGYFTAYADLLQQNIDYTHIAKAVADCLAWSALFLSLAWWRFRTRDVLV